MVRLFYRCRIKCNAIEVELYVCVFSARLFSSREFGTNSTVVNKADVKSYSSPKKKEKQNENKQTPIVLPDRVNAIVLDFLNLTKISLPSTSSIVLDRSSKIAPNFIETPVFNDIVLFRKYFL